MMTHARATTIARVLLVMLGVMDIIRGLMHTYFVRYAAANIAKMEAHPDALFVMGAFGCSNFLTAFIFFLIAWKAKELSGYILALIPLAYLVGGVGMKVSQLSRQSEFNGKYMMTVYLLSCVVVSALFFLSKRKSE